MKQTEMWIIQRRKNKKQGWKTIHRFTRSTRADAINAYDDEPANVGFGRGWFDAHEKEGTSQCVEIITSTPENEAPNDQ